MATARVLVVDDEPAILELAGRALDHAGYFVLRASAPHEALEVVRRESGIDLVISDVVMPEMKGTELAGEVQRLSPSTRVLLISGYVGPSEAAANLPFLPKPFSSQALIAAVQRVLAESSEDRRRLRRSIDESRRLQAASEQTRMEVKELEQAARASKKRSKEILRRAKPPKG